MILVIMMMMMIVIMVIMMVIIMMVIVIIMIMTRCWGCCWRLVAALPCTAQSSGQTPSTWTRWGTINSTG